MHWSLILLGFIAGIFSGAVGFGGGMIILPIITYFYGVEVAVPISTIAQLMSNLSKVGMGFKEIKWKQVGMFLILAAPFTALGALGFAKVDKQLMTKILCVFLIIFAILKLTGKFKLPQKRGTMLIGGGITGLINGLLGISGPLSSAVFLTLELAPVAYIASEAAAASAMHIIKTIVYGKLNLMNGNIFLVGLCIGAAMIIGNYIALKTIKKVKNKLYQRIVVVVMIGVSIWLFFSV
ncbi:MAG: sulfite exporter TauE/SafE family protein [Bacteroidales bacterium]|nr:sulfite exporter TauE/SafE family protein [Bacteroidales bacterium]MDD4669969.1 sulfite exporter TauE/SafE family protein [Bacteroidales bacterium]